jgi:cobalamin biosynthesis protein CobT
MGAGRFDVYRNPPKVRPKYPVVALSVDMSSSMGGFWYGSGRPHMADYFQTGQASYHAMLSAMLVARALQAIRCPFEVTGFGGGSDVYMMKSFGMPYNDTAKYALGGIYTDPNGGTPAAEGLALAYARVMTRPEQRKVIIQITDAGVPENTRRLAHALRDDGITVIGIGIGTDDERTRKYYGDGFAVEHAQELPSRFVQLLRRLSINGELR